MKETQSVILIVVYTVLGFVDHRIFYESWTTTGAVERLVEVRQNHQA